MRFPALIPSICVAALVISCSETDPVVQPVEPPASGTVVVFVHWEDTGLPDMRVELLELGVSMTTDDSGLARFTAPAGSYTLRAYGINRGGPPLLHVDSKVTVTAQQEVRVEVESCLPCV